MPASDIPTPANSTPSGMRAAIDRLSEKMPKSGCTTEELTVEASIKAPAAAKESPLSAMRNGNNAATAPWLTSVNRCPAERTDIARRSTLFLGAVLKSALSRQNGCRRRSARKGYYQSSEISYGATAQTRWTRSSEIA